MTEQLLERPRPRNEQMIDQVARRYYDTATEAAEGLDGVMHTEIPLGFDGEDAFSIKDGTRLGRMSRYGVASAYVAVAKNPNLAFLLERTLTEADEIRIVQEMAEGKGCNTLIVPSDYPEELMDATEHMEGFNQDRKQTMLRMYFRRSNGTIDMVTQTLDGSNREALASIYEMFEEPLKDGSTLGQRIHRDLSEEEQDELSGLIVDTYDESMHDQFGGEWNAGRPLNEDEQRINTYEFALAQEDILIPYIHSDVYDDPEAKKGFMKIMTERFNKARLKSSGEFVPLAYATSPHIKQMSWHLSDEALIHQLQGAAVRADVEQFVFSACGGTIKPSGVSFNPHDALANAGFTKTETTEEYSWDGGDNHQGTCVNCKEGPKPVGVKDWCQDCIEGHCG